MRVVAVVVAMLGWKGQMRRKSRQECGGVEVGSELGFAVSCSSRLCVVIGSLKQVGWWTTWGER